MGMGMGIWHGRGMGMAWHGMGLVLIEAISFGSCSYSPSAALCESVCSGHHCCPGSLLQLQLPLQPPDIEFSPVCANIYISLPGLPSSCSRLLLSESQSWPLPASSSSVVTPTVALAPTALSRLHRTPKRALRLCPPSSQHHLFAALFQAPSAILNASST